LRRLEEESVSQAAAVTATAKALQQSQYRYQAGLVTYLEVATNEAANLQAQLSNVSIETRRMNASVLLVKALGGGWRGASSLAFNAGQVCASRPEPCMVKESPRGLPY